MNTQMTWFRFPLFNPSPPLLRTVPFRLIIIYNIDRHDVICVYVGSELFPLSTQLNHPVSSRSGGWNLCQLDTSQMCMYVCTSSDDDIYLENKCSCIKRYSPFSLPSSGLSAIGSCLSIGIAESRGSLFRFETFKSFNHSRLSDGGDLLISGIFTYASASMEKYRFAVVSLNFFSSSSFSRMEISTKHLVNSRHRLLWLEDNKNDHHSKFSILFKCVSIFLLSSSARASAHLVE